MCIFPHVPCTPNVKMKANALLQAIGGLKKHYTKALRELCTKHKDRAGCKELRRFLWQEKLEGYLNKNRKQFRDNEYAALRRLAAQGDPKAFQRQVEAYLRQGYNQAGFACPEHNTRHFCSEHCALKHRGNLFEEAKRPICAAGCHANTNWIQPALRKIGNFFRDVGKEIEKAVKWVGQGLKKAFDFVGHIVKKIKEGIISFGRKAFAPIVNFAKKQFYGLLVSVSKSVGFSQDDIAAILDPRTGRANRNKIRRVVLNRLVDHHVKPLIAGLITKLVNWGLDQIGPALDRAVEGVINAISFIPFAGPALAIAGKVGWKIGFSALKDFVIGKVTELITDKLVKPLAQKGMNALRGAGGEVRRAIDKLFARAYDFFEKWVKLPRFACRRR